jgi:hypothetical protein
MAAKGFAALALATALMTFVVVRRRRDVNAKSASCDGRQFVVRRSDNPDDWKQALHNVSKSDMKQRELFLEPGSGRFALELVLGPNQKYPAHLHISNEWCFLIQGEIKDQFGIKYAGDFFYNEIRSLHYGIQAGREGCTILVVKDLGGNIPKPELDQ